MFSTGLMTGFIKINWNMRRNELTITTFNPLIVTAHSDDIISHEKKELDSVSSKLVRMRDANGNHVDIVQQDQMPRDLTSIRMNVNSFQEAYDLLTAHGFKSNRTDGTISQDKTAKGIGIVSPSGFMIAVAEHIKKE